MSNELSNVTVDDLVFGEHAEANLKRALGWCAAVQRSGMLPKHITTPQQALVTMLKGKELGLSPIVALSQVYVVGGKAEISGTIMEALLRKGGVSITTEVWTKECCRLVFKRQGFEPFTSEFTIEEAKAAGLLKNSVWNAYTKDMLYWRALSRGARRIGADLIHGCYVEGEIKDAPEIIRDIQPVKDAPRASSQAKIADRLGITKPFEAAPAPVDIDPDTVEIVPPPREDGELFGGMDDESVHAQYDH